MHTSDIERRVRKLNVILDVARAMGAKRDFDALLDLIAEASRRVVEADRCTLYIYDREAGELWSKIAHGESQKIRLAIGKGIAGFVARTREPLIIKDAYADPRFNRDVDRTTGYRTRNILCVPMVDDIGSITGVIQVLNKRDGLDFDVDDQDLLLALGGQAAVALQNATLHAEIQRLFDSFIKASVYAIEARDPTTHGHSERVAELTVALARALEHQTSGPYVGIVLGEEVIRELRYAALLHDFGKVGVRENVLLKENKLYPHEFALISARFDFVRRTVEYDFARRRGELLQGGPADAVRLQLEELEREAAAELRMLDDALDLVIACNRPTVLDDGNFEKLQKLGAYTYRDARGISRPLLTSEEIACLSIRRGSLNNEERHEIEAHVEFTYKFLSQIPWTRELKNVPSIAYAHHEKLSGEGYPRGLLADQIPLQARIMSIADMYDALTAADRPYKKAVPHDRAIDILLSEVKRGSLDPDLLRIFVEAGVYQVVRKND
ncbi:MAG: GAF domain-containing protein [Deltaproteobacteria bacterium]|nr:GAF domain-containing protein [Deltaproteobacteria bacterium]